MGTCNITFTYFPRLQVHSFQASRVTLRGDIYPYHISCHVKRIEYLTKTLSQFSLASIRDVQFNQCRRFHQLWHYRKQRNSFIWCKLESLTVTQGSREQEQKFVLALKNKMRVCLRLTQPFRHKLRRYQSFLI